jgi:hypothetical protein
MDHLIAVAATAAAAAAVRLPPVFAAHMQQRMEKAGHLLLLLQLLLPLLLVAQQQHLQYQHQTAEVAAQVQAPPAVMHPLQAASLLQPHHRALVAAAAHALAALHCDPLHELLLWVLPQQLHLDQGHDLLLAVALAGQGTAAAPASAQAWCPTWLWECCC